MSTIQLSDGRSLAYEEYGDLQGRPVFFFHGTPGSRFFHPPQEVTQRMGVRLITTDRPGYGASTYQPGRVLSDWPKDVRTLADALGIDQFHIAGHSGGGPHTLACAHGLPERVIAAATLSGAGPVDCKGATQGLTPLNSFGFKYGRYLPFPLTRLIVWFTFHQRRSDPEKFMDSENGKRSKADEILMNSPELRELCLKTEIEAFRQGLQGTARDVSLITRGWDFKMEEIKVPVHIWHGTADNLTTLAMARAMAARIPVASITVLEGEGHMLLFPHWEEILKKLFSVRRSR